jgi:hypothetical protein
MHSGHKLWEMYASNNYYLKLDKNAERILYLLMVKPMIFSQDP